MAADGGGGRQHGLFALSYVSRAVEPDMESLLRVARAVAVDAGVRNGLASITGALCVGDGCFAQVLEGPGAAVLDTFDRILADPRHQEVRLLEFIPIACRRFAGWSMAFSGELAPGILAGAAVEHRLLERLGRGSVAHKAQVIAAAMEVNLRPFP
ncbi:BLUF domain-containing protein [Falsiroseomonas ponticola]|jgi:hypothetical protein|uniref:BLUF domain-containing protein n=1 Tax=Falsiroseomonas ponticola TaxID=2786951 RepID=UPI001934065A|nr:BLUF domain-containing protein [Roseomonas ponticola]